MSYHFMVLDAENVTQDFLVDHSGNESLLGIFFTFFICQTHVVFSINISHFHWGVQPWCPTGTSTSTSPIVLSVNK